MFDKYAIAGIKRNKCTHGLSLLPSDMICFQWYDRFETIMEERLSESGGNDIINTVLNATVLATRRVYWEEHVRGDAWL